MFFIRNPRWSRWTLALLLATASVAIAQGTSPPAPSPVPPAPTSAAPSPSPAPSPPPSPVTGIRNKISASDLPSAESVLEVWRAEHGEGGPFLVGLSWLARGALLVGETDKARRYVADVRARCADSLARGVDLNRSHEVEIALGAAIEVDAQLIAREKGARAAAEMLRAELARVKGPVAFRSRLYKRLDMLTLVGAPAPELAIEDQLGAAAPTLGSLRGKPVVLFVWAEYCGDCRAQAAALARVRARHAADGLQVVALTRYFDPDSLRVTEKARVDSVWKASYSEVGVLPIVFSTASMERYGGSSTPTFVFVDRRGIVRGYTPTRLTEAEFDKALAAITR